MLYLALTTTKRYNAYNVQYISFKFAIISIEFLHIPKSMLMMLHCINVLQLLNDLFNELFMLSLPIIK